MNEPLNTTAACPPMTGFARIQLFLALSRTPHGLLDMAAPALGALLVLGDFPPVRVVLLGLLATFAGYTAVYALNDLVGYRSDREKFRQGAFGASCGDLDAIFVRHPMAQGQLSLMEGLLWTAAWSALAVAAAWQLNPMCVLIFALGGVLEAIYCLLWRVSPLRTVVNGAVKCAGPVAGMFAVDPSPAPVLVTALFLCLFLWEVGGQNVPNDWSDLAEDQRFGGRTIPVCLGREGARQIIWLSLWLGVLLAPLLFVFSPGPFGPVCMLAVLAVGAGLLLAPAYRLYKNQDGPAAMALFNRASYYPLALLVVAVIFIGLR